MKKIPFGNTAERSINENRSQFFTKQVTEQVTADSVLLQTRKVQCSDEH